MTAYIGTHEAARLLGVTPATLYAYVSRGRITRRSGPDGRTSLFALADVEALSSRSRRAPVGPRPTIDVRIASSITTLGDDGVVVRGHDLPALAGTRSFEAIAELLWSGALPERDPVWPACADRDVVSSPPVSDPLARLVHVANVLADRHLDDDPSTAARRLITAAPVVLGARRATGSIAVRLASAARARPTPALVGAIDVALGLLADHELATSTLAVRVAASVRARPMIAYLAGLAVVSGPLHGSASATVHRFLAECETEGVAETIARHRAIGAALPGFGHKVYRGPDPRCAPLLDAVRRVGDASLVDAVIAEAGRVVPRHPNVDLALGALSYVAGLDATPLFAVARIAGWAAHYAEELDAPPLRYRGITA